MSMRLSSPSDRSSPRGGGSPSPGPTPGERRVAPSGRRPRRRRGCPPDVCEILCNKRLARQGRARFPRVRSGARQHVLQPRRDRPARGAVPKLRSFPSPAVQRLDNPGIGTVPAAPYRASLVPLSRVARKIINS